MTVVEGQPPVLGRLSCSVGEGLGHPGSRAPGDVKARHGIAVAERLPAAALGPADHGRQADPMLLEPGALLAGGEFDIGARPWDRPFVLGQRPVQTVPASAAPPVAPGQIEAVANAQPSLLRGADQKQAAE
ncbi:hypothetical protein D3C86_978280 [compost metagenome]